MTRPKCKSLIKSENTIIKILKKLKFSIFLQIEKHDVY